MQTKQNSTAKDNKRIDSDLLTMQQACTYLGYKRSYLYHLTSQRKIPHYKPTGKVIFFSKRELRKWIQAYKVELACKANYQATNSVTQETSQDNTLKEEIL